ncbi:MAG TPA: N-methyl-L-tryptophan oxidase [Verrucomicrobiae bacterium]|jgi:sarcosine oxidase|nr:N-methyl-L-tryptophan oxidase [Verrucomicrobiae bacterium]
MSGYDVVVLGLGGMGSAAAAHLAKRGKRVLGLEQFDLGHDLGASAGRSRIIRKAYFEDPAYVPLLARAYDLWRELENETNEVLLDLVGTLMIGAPGSSTMLDGVRRSAQQYGVAVSELSRSQVIERYPHARLLADEIGLFEPEAGIVFPERGIAAHQTVARAWGARLRGNVKVTSWERRSGGTIGVDLAGGEIVEAEQLVLCAGPWLAEIVPVPLTVQRNVQVWFTPQGEGFARGQFPTFFVDRAGWPKPLYGFPDLGDGLKAALHGYGAVTTPAALDREIHAEDIAAVKSAMDAWLPGGAGEFRLGKACMYALTPDEHFIIDRHPQDDGVVIAGGFSGHGYKFCPVVGEIVADLVDGKARHDTEFLKLRRFAKST